MHVRPAILSDASGIADITNRAFQGDELWEFCCPYGHLYPLTHRHMTLRRVKARFYSGFYILVVVSDPKDSFWHGSEEVLGQLSMKFMPARSQPTESSWPAWSWNYLNSTLHWLEDQWIWYLNLDKSASKANMRRINSSFDSFDFPCKENFYEVHLVATDPEYQSRGVGGRLLEEAQRIARVKEVPLQLIASTKGYGLYKKCGFVERGERLRSEGVEREGIVMVWEPREDERNVSTST